MKLGTRGSDLALWQARLVRALLLEKAGVETEQVIIKTTGDKDQVATFDKMEGKGFFTKEIEAALLDHNVDLAVHSLKDLQTIMPPGLTMGAVLHRADRRDLLLVRSEAADESVLLGIREGASVGTSSARRAAQLRYLRPDLNIVPLRGNVPTRVRRLQEGKFDAIVVASAGVDRLELSLDGLNAHRVSESILVPAPAQGVLGIQIRVDDAQTTAAVSTLDQPDLADIVWLEREILRRLEGGCQLPLGTCADRVDGGFRLRLFLGGENPASPHRVVISGTTKEATAEAALSFVRGEAILPRHSSPRKSVWITREPARAADYQNNVDSDYIETAALPVFCAIEAGDSQRHEQAIGQLDTYGWIFFTSQIAVQQFAELLNRHGASLGATPLLAAIGAKTARAMKELGWHADFVSSVADAVSLGEAFCQHTSSDGAGHPEDWGRILFPCSARASQDLENTVAQEGLRIERLECYDTVEHPLLAGAVLSLSDPDIVVFTSPSAAKFLLARRPLTKKTAVISIGPSTTETLLREGFPIVWESPDRSLEGLAEVTNGLIAN